MTKTEFSPVRIWLSDYANVRDGAVTDDTKPTRLAFGMGWQAQRPGSLVLGVRIGDLEGTEPLSVQPKGGASA